MNIREQWNKQAENVDRSFSRALAIAADAKKCFHDYLMIDEEEDVLNTQWSNWKNNRFEIVVVGEFSTGKSTFINALLRKDVLPSKVNPTTATINFIRHMEQADGIEKAVITFTDGHQTEAGFEQLEEYVTEMSKKHNVVEEIAYVELFIDSPYLKDGVVIVDTPGLQALHPEHERITKEQIKKSNASILLFNMEQPGKLSEFIFLKDLSDSIERIFFVANRLDQVPENEVDDVIYGLETALKENEYQPISPEHAKIYPTSAKQALKARDKHYQTKYWNDWSEEQLLDASRFLDFEHRLEDYLFNGEKTKDLLRAPYQALQFFYQQLEKKVNEIEVFISGEISIEELQKEKERLMEEVELRKLQLQDQERNLKNLFHDVLNEHEKEFNERKEQVLQQFVTQIQELEFIEDLEAEVSDVMIQLNKDIQKLVDQGLMDLANQLEMKMRREIDNFEITLEDYSKDNIRALTDTEISISMNINTERINSAFEIQEETYAEAAAALEEQKKLLKQKQEQEQKLESLKKRQELVASKYDREESFLDMLLNTTESTKKEYGVIKKRKIWVDKKGMKDVPNEEYEKLVKEKRELMKKADMEKQELHYEWQEIHKNIVLNDSEWDSMQDYYEEKRRLRQQRDAERIEKLRERTRLEERQLKKEQKKVIREIEDVFENLRREYRSLLRGLDALKLAQEGIKQHIQEKDLQYQTKVKELENKEKLLAENEQKQESYKKDAEKIDERIEKEKEIITNYLLACY